MKKTPENIVKSQIKKWLDYHGWFSFPLTQGLGSYKGLPDRIAVKNGVVLFIEIKSLGGKMSPFQRQFKKDMEYAGGNYLLVYSCEDLEREIEKIKMLMDANVL